MKMKPHITTASDAVLFEELDKCKVAKVLLSKTAFKKTWAKYESAIKAEIASRNSELAEMNDEELLTELFA
jgi:hypothetical protein